MNSKIILLLGAIVSFLITFNCLKKQYQSENQSKKRAIVIPNIKSTKRLEKKKEEKVKFKEPSLVFRYNKYLKARLSNDDKNTFSKILNNVNCSKNVDFSNDIHNARWINFISKIITFINKNKIKNTSITVLANSIEINATFEDKKLFDEFKKIVSQNSFLNIKNNISLVTKKTQKIEVKEKQKAIINIKEIQKDIDYTLKKNPVYFRFNSDKLTDKGERTLKEILKILKILNKQSIKFNILVEDHLNATGNKNYDKKLSQKRAESVKRYLLKHSKNHKIIAKGYGSSKPLTKTPKDKRNRRVEIIITKGYI